MLTLIKDKVTLHHVEKKADKGETTEENGALLIKTIHQWLHNHIERNDLEMYYLINECLQLYKICVMEDRQELLQQWEQECVPEFRKELK